MAAGENGDRALRLLLGMRHAGVAEELRFFGLSRADRDEGFERLRALVAGLLRADPTTGSALVGWALHWLPLADASLYETHPSAHAWLFTGLQSPAGVVDATLAVAAFLQRVRSLHRAPGLGAEGSRALARLERLGLDRSVRSQAERSLARLGESSGKATTELAQESAHHEARLRAWTLRCSQLTHLALEQRRLRLQLGYARSGEANAGQCDNDAPLPRQPADVTDVH